MASADIKDIYGRKVGSIEINDGGTPPGWGEAPCGPADSLADHDTGTLRWKVAFWSSFGLMAVSLLVCVLGIFMDIEWLFYSTNTTSSHQLAMMSAVGVFLLAISQGAAIAEDMEYWIFTRFGSIIAIALGIIANVLSVVEGSASILTVIPIFGLIAAAATSYICFEYCYLTREG